MPHTTLLEIPPAEQAQMLAALRRARYGYLLALHVLLLCATGRTPTEIAAVLFCSRSSVYRIVRLYHAAQLGFTVDEDGLLAAPVRTTVLMPWIKRTVDALLKASPQAFGWCRTRWSCATLACELQAKHRLEVSAGTVRRWLHESGWVWKRAKLVAKDNDPQRVERLARIRWQMEPLQAHARFGLADALAIPLWPKVGAAWMPRGSPEEVLDRMQNTRARALSISPRDSYAIVSAPSKTRPYYDWRKAEAKLNTLLQFITNIDGLDIHYIHVRSRHPNALPLIMTGRVALLGEQRQPQRGRYLDSHGGDRVPWRDLPGAKELDGAGLPQAHLLSPRGQRRALRGLGTAAALL